MDRLLRLVLGAVLLYFVLTRTVDGEALARLADALWVLPALVGLTVFGTAVEAYRLGFLFRSQAMNLPFWSGCRVVAMGTFFNFCIPGGTGGDVAKLYYLARDRRGQRVEVATLLVVDRAVALFALLVLILGLALMNTGLLREYPVLGVLNWVALATALFVIVFFALALTKVLRANALYRWAVARLPLGGLLDRVALALYAFRNCKRNLVYAAVISFVGHLALMGMFTVVGSVVMPDASASVVAWLALLGMLANAIPITPGGLGVGEAAFDQLFRMLGYAGGAALILSWRLGSVPICIVGCVLYVVGKRSRALDEETAPEAA